MLDFTPHAKLHGSWLNRYKIVRIFLGIFFVAGLGVVAHSILFPSQPFFFSFQNPNKKSNAVFFIRNEKEIFPEKGKFFQNDRLDFDIFSPRYFSNARLEINFNKNSPLPEKIPLTVKKSYKAFSYPREKNFAGFKNGTLLKNKESFFIAYDQKLEKFSDIKSLQALGYNPDQFLNISDEELSLNKTEIANFSEKDYPDGSVFKIDDRYYEFRGGILYEYIRKKAFLSHHNEKNALLKDKFFLKKYLISDENIGFSAGTILSFNNAVYIVVENAVKPFDNEITFLAMGFSWEDVISASDEEIHFYKKEGLFSLDDPHPSGTVFKAVENYSEKYFLVADGKLKEISGKIAVDSYLTRKPIIIEEESLRKESVCALKRKFWPLRTLACSVKIEDLNYFKGNNFQFSVNIPEKTEVDSIQAIFFTEINWSNLRDTLSNIKHKVKLNYGLASPK